MKSIPGIHKSLKKYRLCSFYFNLKFVFFALTLPISGISRVPSPSIFRICGINRPRFALIFPICGINRDRSASIFRICGINRLRFALSNLWKKQSSLRFELSNLWNKQNLLRFDLSMVSNKQGLLCFDFYKFWNKQVRFASISKTKTRSKLRSAFVSISLPLLSRTGQCASQLSENL